MEIPSGSAVGAWRVMTAERPPSNIGSDPLQPPLNVVCGNADPGVE